MEEHSFDALAKEMADGAISRGRALKYFGAAILGSMLGGGLLGLPLAEARKKHHKKKKCKHSKPAGAFCNNSAECCPQKTKRLCAVAVNASNSDKTCCGANGATCGPKNGDGDDTAPFCCSQFTCTNGVCQPAPQP